MMTQQRWFGFCEYGTFTDHAIPAYLEGEVEFSHRLGFRLVRSREFDRSSIANPNDCPRIYHDFEALSRGNGELCISEIGFRGGGLYIVYADDFGRMIECASIDGRVGMELEFDIQRADGDGVDRHTVKVFYDETFGKIIRIWARRTICDFIATAFEDGKIITIQV